MNARISYIASMAQIALCSFAFSKEVGTTNAISTDSNTIPPPY